MSVILNKRQGYSPRDFERDSSDNSNKTSFVTGLYPRTTPSYKALRYYYQLLLFILLAPRLNITLKNKYQY
jgi:hypothetical protein